MFATSRESRDITRQVLEEVLASSDAVAASGAQVGADLFAVVELLEGQRSLRIALADASLPEEVRERIARDLFEEKISEGALSIVVKAVTSEWSEPRDLRDSLVELGRLALLKSAEAQGQLETVEDELFRLSRILIDHPELEQNLDARFGTEESRAGLLSKVLYGKVTAVTEALAAQAIARPEHLPADDFQALSALAAEVRGRCVAYVTSASELSSAQKEALEERLTALFKNSLTVHHEVDASILGGVVIRVGDEIIDSSTAGRLSALRAQLA